jgi:hypothetical protein
MVWHRHGDCRVLDPLLHHDVTAPPANLNESFTRENSANLTAGQNAQPTQPRPQDA